MYARLARPRRLLGGPLQPLGWLLAAVLACCVARLAGVEDALTAAQFALTVVLLAALLLLVDIWLSPTVTGAGDNASGVALALRARGAARTTRSTTSASTCCSPEPRRAGPTGCARSCAATARDLPRDRTVVPQPGRGRRGHGPCTRREGPVLALRSHAQLATLAGEIAAEAGRDGPRALDNRAPSDGFAASSAGYAALTVTCRDELGLAPRCTTAAATCPSTWSARAGGRRGACASSWPSGSTPGGPRAARGLAARGRPSSTKKSSACRIGERVAAGGAAGVAAHQDLLHGHLELLAGQRARHLGHGHDAVRHVAWRAVLAHARAGSVASSSVVQLGALRHAP